MGHHPFSKLSSNTIGGNCRYAGEQPLPFKTLERYCRLIGVETTSVTLEEQQSDYEAGLAVINGETWRIRTARVTPTKPGAFVALWHRDASGETCPFEADEDVAGVLILVADSHHFGAFTFDTAHLRELGVLRSPETKGKRGFRVYPSWSGNLNPQASRSQRAQARAFTDLTE